MFQPVPGVTVEDMGHKMGLNGVDNAKLTFDQVRVPRENLLNKYSDITPEGEFVTKIEKGGPRARFLAMADQLVRGRESENNNYLPLSCNFLLGEYVLRGRASFCLRHSAFSQTAFAKLPW